MGRVGNWQGEEALEKIGMGLVECGKTGENCWILRTFLDEVLEVTGPWQLAHFFATSNNKQAVDSLKNYLVENVRFYADWVERMLSASTWDAETGEVVRDFGAV